MRNQLDLQKTSTYQKRVRFTTNDQILRSWMIHETNSFIKEEAHDHRKATKLVMNLQSSEIKLADAILLRVLTLKKVTFSANRVTQKISWEPLKKSAFCHLGIVTDPKRSFHTKNHAYTTTAELMGLKGLIYHCSAK